MNIETSKNTPLDCLFLALSFLLCAIQQATALIILMAIYVLYTKNAYILKRMLAALALACIPIGISSLQQAYMNGEICLGSSMEIMTVFSRVLLFVQLVVFLIGLMLTLICVWAARRARNTST
ncbi:MAG: hypothetical protein LKJ90_06310 [Faecalibacterium sp.]|jgi:hypothetical protein|nr:hypothetical protein [Faecalibacterium sp.]